MPKMEIAGVGDDDSKQAFSLDIDEETIQKLRLGEKISLSVEGSVGLLEIPPDGLREGEKPMLGVRVDSVKVEGSNEFADLAGDEEDDD